MEIISQILEYPLLKIHKYQLTPFDILLIIGMYIIVRLIVRLLKSKLTEFVFNKNNIELGRQASLLQIIQYILYTIFVTISLQIVGVDLSIVMAGSAALLVGLGFGIQHIFNDLVSGLIMLFEGNVEVGDIIDAGGLIGKIEKVGLRTSTVKTRDAFAIVIPNSKFINENVINWTHLNHVTRFEVAVGVAYGSDVQLVKKLLLHCAEEHGKAVDKPAPFVRFKDFGNSSLDFVLYFWSSDIWVIEDVKSDLRFMIDAAFRKHDICIPFPQRDLHIKSSEVAFGKD